MKCEQNTPQHASEIPHKPLSESQKKKQKGSFFTFSIINHFKKIQRIIYYILKSQSIENNALLAQGKITAHQESGTHYRGSCFTYSNTAQECLLCIS